MNNSVDDKLRNQTRGAVHAQTGATYHPKRLGVDFPLQSGTGHPALRIRALDGFTRRDARARGHMQADARTGQAGAQVDEHRALQNKCLMFGVEILLVVNGTLIRDRSRKKPEERQNYPENDTLM